MAKVREVYPEPRYEVELSKQEIIAMIDLLGEVRDETKGEVYNNLYRDLYDIADGCCAYSISHVGIVTKDVINRG